MMRSEMCAATLPESRSVEEKQAAGSGAAAGRAVLVDTHSHIYEAEFDADRREAFGRAAAAGVGMMLLPALDAASDGRLFATCREYAETVRPMMGLHPTSVNNNPRWREELERVERYLASPPEGVEGFCGVGEIGLDFYWSDAFRKQQCEAFAAQVELALKYNLPIAVHTRGAWERMCDIMRSFAGRGVRGVFHAFTEGAECCARLRGAGDFLFGIGGMTTFRNNPMAATVRELDIGDMVLETDSPYLAPVPYRGRRNEPAYVRIVCGRVAEIKGMETDEVAARTTANAVRMFGLAPACEKNGSQAG